MGGYGPGGGGGGGWTGGPPSGSPPGSGGGVPVTDWYGRAWTVLQSRWVELWVLALVQQILLSVAFVACLVPGLLVMGPLYAGLMIYCARWMLGEEATFGDLFVGFRKFGPTTVLALVLLLVPILASVVFVVPWILASGASGSSEDAAAAFAALGSCATFFVLPLLLIVYPLVVGTFTVFALPLVLFRNLDAMEAIKTSSRTVKPYFLSYLGFWGLGLLIYMVAGSVGGMLVCIGSLLLQPLAMAWVILAILVAYRDVYGLEAGDLALYR